MKNRRSPTIHLGCGVMLFASLMAYGQGVRTYTPEEALEAIKAGTAPPELAIDWSDGSTPDLSPVVPADTPARPTVRSNAFSPDNPRLVGDESTAAGLAMLLGRYGTMLGDGSATRVELVSHLTGFSQDAVQAMADVAKRAADEEEAIRVEERTLACEEVKRQGVSPETTEQFLAHFDRISDRAQRLYLGLYQELPQLLPSELVTFVYEQADTWEIHVARTGLNEEMVADQDLATRYVRDYCAR